MNYTADHYRTRATGKALELLANQEDWITRFELVKGFSSSIRSSEYHLTNACNIRCKGCWFFEYGHDKGAREKTDIADWRDFIKRESERGVNSALLIGGEPTLFEERIAEFAIHMDPLAISTNGLIKLPFSAPFTNATVFISLFGGGPLDDDLRAIKPNGKAFTGLFDSALANYRNDPRATFVYAVTEDGIEYIEDTVKKIRDNGNRLTFNFYSKYDSNHPLKLDNERRLLELLSNLKAKYPKTITNHPEHIKAIVTGNSWLGTFSYEVCPSISSDHPDNVSRKSNGNPILPGFNTYKPDLETLEVCCTSGHCSDCRDSQAVYSWLLTGLKASLGSEESLKTWIEVAEAYWSQFIWSPYCQVTDTSINNRLIATS